MTASFNLQLFHPRLVRERMAAVSIESIHLAAEILKPWLDHLASGTLNETNEISLHGGFLERIFCDVLGYHSQAKAIDGRFELSAEESVLQGRADAAIGFFSPSGRTVLAPIELKGASQHLEQAKNKATTPVQQAWDYANKLPASRWIIVSNYRETRLYAKALGPAQYELFQLEDLAGEAGIRRFLALLSRSVLLPSDPSSRSLLDELLVTSQEADRAVTNQLYHDYKQIRADLFSHLQQRHSNWLPNELLEVTQTVLDRVLFLAFAEDRALIPPKSIQRAVNHKDPYDPRPAWQNFIKLFEFVDKGNAALGIPEYNGGLFRANEAVSSVEISDEICKQFQKLSEYDFRDDVSVEVLGHVFEQSISDLEELRALAGSSGKPATDTQKKPSKRRAEGIFYTPPFITSFLIRETLQPALADALARAAASAEATLSKTSPGTDDKRRGARTLRSREGQALMWEAYQYELRSLRVLDPACGSGAFLVAAFDSLAAEFDRANRNLAELRGKQHALFDLNKTVLNENLFGIDLNGESVEISRLSLWLKTAQRQKTLAFLDRNVRKGNSVVSDPLIDPWAFDWASGRIARTFLEDVEPKNEALSVAVDERWKSGFDVVLGNPPYVRHELLTDFKDHWSTTFETFDSTADLFVYFFERGLKVLKPGGRLGFIVSNKWLKGGYAERLRVFLKTSFTIERIVDFGHAPVFRDADAFPCVIVIRKDPPPPDHEVPVTAFPRERLGDELVAGYVEGHRFLVPQAGLGAGGWSLEPPAVSKLLEKIQASGQPLEKFLGVRPLYGIKTGFNEAFFIDQTTRDRLVQEDPAANDVIRKYLRGQDIDRWTSSWAGMWAILLRSSDNCNWPWAKETSVAAAETKFQQTFPSIFKWMKSHEQPLRKREDQGRFWWELRSCAYYDAFEKERILIHRFMFHPSFSISDAGVLTNDASAFLPSSDRWVTAVLNSPTFWYFAFKRFPHKKDETIAMDQAYVLSAPIPPENPASLPIVDELRGLKLSQAMSTDLIRVSLRSELDTDPFSSLPEEFCRSTRDDFIASIRSGLPKKKKLSTGTIQFLMDVWSSEVQKLRGFSDRMAALERSLAKDVALAYGISTVDDELMWMTAPPRMPIPNPHRNA